MQTKDKNLIYGRHPVIDALHSGLSIDKIFLQQGTRGEFEIELRKISKARNIPVLMTPKEKLGQMAKGNHQGVIAVMGVIDYHHLVNLLPVILLRKEFPLFVIIEGVTDIRNFGAIARSAEICGVDALIVPTRKSAQINAESLKASAGALANIPVCREQNIIAAIDLLQTNGVQVLASDLKAEKMVYDLDLKEASAFVLGSEAQGITKPVARQADERFIIPQVGKGDSFNVSVAAGIMLYEALRQRAIP